MENPAPSLAEDAEPAPPAPPRPRLHPLVRVILYLLAFGFIQYTMGTIVAIGVYSLDDRQFEEGGLVRSKEALMLLVMLCIPPMLAVTWLFVRYLDRRPTLAAIGARWPPGGRWAVLRQAVTIPLGTLVLVGVWLILLLALPSNLAQVRFDGMSQVFQQGPAWWPAAPGLLLALLLVLFLLQGGLEEWILRGYVYHAFKERWSPWAAALASSVLFALIHLGNHGITALALLNIVLAGFVLAALVERSGSLWGASLAHGVWNFCLACLLSVPVSGVKMFHLLNVSLGGDERWTGGEFGPEGSLILTALGLPLAFFLWRPLKEIAPSAPEDVPSLPPQGEGMAQNLQPGD